MGDRRVKWDIGRSAVLLLLVANAAHAQLLSHVRVSDDGRHFVRGTSDARFIVWGVNYDHDGSGRLLDEYWIDEWDTVVEDFREIKALGANCVRIHLQLGMFMDAADRPNDAARLQLAKLVQLAETNGLYLDVTGLACYHKKQIPTWYDQLGEQDRWTVQAQHDRAERRAGGRSVDLLGAVEHGVAADRLDEREGGDLRGRPSEDSAVQRAGPHDRPVAAGYVPGELAGVCAGQCEGILRGGLLLRSQAAEAAGCADRAGGLQLGWHADRAVDLARRDSPRCPS